MLSVKSLISSARRSGTVRWTPSRVDDILGDWMRNVITLLTQVEALKAERNVVSKEMGKLKDAAEREQKIAHPRSRRSNRHAG